MGLHMNQSKHVLGLGPRWGLAVLIVIVSAACTQQVVQAGSVADVAPQLSVERFLQAANARDLHGMGRIFGTADGAMMDTGSTVGCMFKKIGSWFGGASCRSREDVEIQMDAIASILKHEDYRIVREEMVAGQEHSTTRVLVTLTIGGKSVTDVPFDVVQASNGRWMVQNVNLQRVMNGGSR
jgi:hypothetical protein